MESGDSWFLLGASPDLRSQIESAAELHPCNGVRQSPVGGVVLANADLDHALGLLLLRELQPLRIYATASVRRILCDDNTMFRMLQRVPEQAAWSDFRPGEEFTLCDSKAKECAIHCRPVSLGHHYPAFVPAARESQLSPAESSVGLFLQSRSGSCLAYLPAVPRIDEALLSQLNDADVVLFDGTFWSDDELIRIQGSGQTAQQMGHVPVEQALRKLAALRRPRKIFIHINNTNPMLDEAGAQFRQVRDAGWEIAEDGWEFEL